jgi:dihydrofolate synthase/folylpolyglutamate synthase
VALTRHSLPAGYPQAVRELYALQSFGIKLGLKNIVGLLHSVGDPHRRFRTIHIAGTNGKGSTAALIAAVLMEAGFRTGLYTSPHLVDFRERMRIDGREIPAERVVSWSRKLLPQVWGRRSTFFEAVTAMAFGWFAEEKVDIAVIETGLGGRLDATNVLSPILSVITTIGLEHTAILGPTVEHIAFEKAGIIKPRTPCVVGVRPGKARRVIERQARRMNAPLVDATIIPLRIHSRSIDGTTILLGRKGPGERRHVIGWPGVFQVANVRTALASIEHLRRSGLPVPDGALERGLRGVTSLTGMRGRLTLVRRRPRVIVDVGHNPAAVRSLASSLGKLGLRPSVMVVGVADDKDLRSIARALGRVGREVIAVAARTSRALPADDVASAFRSSGVAATPAVSVAAGVRLALRRAGVGGTVLVTGSHFVVGEALAQLERRRYLTISQ